MIYAFFSVPPSVAELQVTAYFRAALEAHHADILQFRANTEAAIDKLSRGQFQEGASPNADQVREFIGQVAEECRSADDPAECRTRMDRLLDATRDRDGASVYLLRWISDLMLDWDEVRFLSPWEAGAYPHLVPRPFPYVTAEKIFEYVPGLDTIRQQSLPHIGHLESSKRHTYPAVAVTYERPFNAASLKSAILQFLIDCVNYELMYGFLRGDDLEGDTVDVDASSNRDATRLLRAMLTNVVAAADPNPEPEYPVPRSDAAHNISQIPSLLKDYETGDVEIGPVHDVLELVKNGNRPIGVLAGLWEAPTEAPCDWIQVAGLLACEWDGMRIPFGGFDRSKILRYGQKTYTSRLTEILASSCSDLFGERREEEIVHAFRPTLPILERLDRLVADEDGTNAVPVIDVLHETAAFVTWIRTQVLQMAGATFERRDHRFTVWMRIYLAAVEQRYTDTVADALCYIYGLQRDGLERRTQLMCIDSSSASRTDALKALAANLVAADDADGFLSALDGLKVICDEPTRYRQTQTGATRFRDEMP